jgi:hypothetical protein
VKLEAGAQGEGVGQAIFADGFAIHHHRLWRQRVVKREQRVEHHLRIDAGDQVAAARRVELLHVGAWGDLENGRRRLRPSGRRYAGQDARQDKACAKPHHNRFHPVVPNTDRSKSCAHYRADSSGIDGQRSGKAARRLHEISDSSRQIRALPSPDE